MSKQDFDQYLQRKAVADTLADLDIIDWEAEKHFWLTKLDELYRTMRQWLREYIEAGQIRLSFHPISLYEEEVGEYTVQEALLTMGQQAVTLTPVGTALVGTKGRVDLRGPAGVIRLVLSDERLAGPRVVYRQRLFTSEAQKAAYYHRQALAPLEAIAVNWVWKISTNPPRISYQELTPDTFFDALLRVLNG